jgi:hypothetical protein
MDPGDALDQDRLAGAVVASERGHLASRHIKTDVHKGLHWPKVLVHPFQPQEGLAGHGGSRRWVLCQWS